MASLYDRWVLPKILGCACASPPVMKQRVKVVPKAEGRVLELGVGMGMNLRFYDPAKVSEVLGVDPSPELRAAAEAAERDPNLKVRIEPGTAEDLPFEDASFDTVVCTFTLCSVCGPAQALGEARRVLKPGGRFLFCEHGLAPDAGVAKWQRRLDGIWPKLFGGCHLSRPVGGTLTAAGFTIEAIETMYLPGTPKIAGWNEWGAARP
jgi:SAM-dependent methyltransferase